MPSNATVAVVAGAAAAFLLVVYLRRHRKSIVLNLPHTEHGKLTETTVEVPLFSLSKHNSLAVDELKVNFEVDLRGLKNDDLVGSLPRRFLTRKSQAQVEIKFKGADASEGVMLINDKIHQTFPR